MKHLLVPYELALELKQKGFDYPCFAYYGAENYLEIEINVTNQSISMSRRNFTTAPLYQQVIDWFEETHNIHIDRIWYNDKITLPRWVYHVEHQYAGSNYDIAIESGLKLIKQ